VSQAINKNPDPHGGITLTETNMFIFITKSVVTRGLGYGSGQSWLSARCFEIASPVFDEKENIDPNAVSICCPTVGIG